MTVPVQTPVTRHVGNGVTTTFSFGFLALLASDLVVSLDGAVTPTSAYSIDGLGQLQGGSVTFVSAPASGVAVVIEQQVRLERTTNYKTNGDLFAAVLNGDFDRIWLAMQSNGFQIGRAPLLGRDDIDGDGAYRAKGNRIQDLGEPVETTDAARVQDLLQIASELAQDGTGQAVVERLADTVAPENGSAMVGYQQTGPRARRRRVIDPLHETASILDYKLANDVDDTAALQALVDSHLFGHMVGPEQVYVISDAIRLRNGQRLDFRGATVVQTASQTPIFDGDDTEFVSIFGGRFRGAKDFINSPSALDIGIKAERAAMLNITGCHFEDFGYAAVRSFLGGEGISIAQCRVRGFADELGTTDRNNSGFVIGGDGIQIHGCRVTNTSQGLIVVERASNVSIASNVITDIPVEHGIYMDTGIQNVAVTGNVISRCAHNGMKFQWYDNSSPGTPVPKNVTISGNTIEICEEDGIQVLNSQPTLALPVRASGITITGNTVRQVSQDLINVRYADDVTISGNVTRLSGRYGIAMTNLSRATVSGNTVVESYENGIAHFGSDAGGRQITVNGNQVVDCGSIYPTALNERGSGILLAGATFVSVYDNRVISTTLVMGFGVQIASSVAGAATIVCHNNHIYGNRTTSGVSLPTGTTSVGYLGDNSARGQTTNNGTANSPAFYQGNPGNQYYGTGVPTTGTWRGGDELRVLDPAPGQPWGYRCTTGGTPGVWKSMGTLAA